MLVLKYFSRQRTAHIPNSTNMSPPSNQLESCPATSPEDNIYTYALILAAAGLFFALICSYVVVPARKSLIRRGAKLQRFLPSRRHTFKNRNPGMSDSEVKLTSFVLMWLTFLIGCGIFSTFEDGFWHPAALVFAAVLPIAVIAFRWFWLVRRRPTYRVMLGEWDDEKIEDGLFYLANDSDEASQHSLV